MSYELKPCPYECASIGHHWHYPNGELGRVLVGHGPDDPVSETCANGTPCYTTAQSGPPSALHTIDCHGIDPATVQEWLDALVESAAAAVAASAARCAADDRLEDLHEDLLVAAREAVR